MDIKKRTQFIEKTDLMQAYLHDLNKLKVMTPAREKELFAQYAEAETEDEKIAIRNQILEGNQRFIFAIAKRYATGDLLSDLISVGNLGAIEAFEKYDPTTGNRFTTIAEYYIRRAINAYLNKDNLLVRPTNNTRIPPRVKKIESEFYAANGRMPMADEVIAILKEKYGIEVNHESEIYGATIEYIEDSANNDDDDYTMEDASEFAIVSASTNDIVTDMNKEEVSHILHTAMDTLSEREANILKMSIGIGDYYKEYKDKEIADILGLSSERVRQLRKDAIAKLHKRLSATIGA